MGCLFCRIWSVREREFIYANDSFYSFYDPNPVSKGHALIIPKRHMNSLVDLREKEQIDFFDALRKVRKSIDTKFNTHSYNIGVNEERAAGQTIMHLHVHVIPRYEGDVKNPAGGIRNVIPGKGNYTEK